MTDVWTDIARCRMGKFAIEDIKVVMLQFPSFVLSIHRVIASGVRLRRVSVTQVFATLPIPQH